MAQVKITELPQALPLTGTESVPIVQNGVTVQTTTGSISGAGALNYPFLTANSTAGLAQARYLTTSSGLSLTDGGAGSTMQINLIGAAQSLNSSGNGIQVKTGTTTVTAVSLAVTTGLTVTNADGTTGNPTIGLGTSLTSINTLGSSAAQGLVTVSGSSFGQTAIVGTTNQINVANGNALGGSPTVSISDNPILPGAGGVTLPNGTTAQRSGTNGTLRYNTSTSLFEGYANGSWGSIITGSGVATFSAGTTGFTPNSPTTGSIVLDGILNVSNGGTGATTLTGYLVGNGTSSVTAVSTIPNAGLTNSAITINGTSVSLGGSISVTASTTNTLTIGTGLSGTSFNGSAPVTIGLANTTVSAGSYTNANITVNAQGQITSASSGSAGGVTAFQTSLNGLTPSISTTGAVTLAGTLGISSGGTGQTTASSAFNALSPITTTGDLIIGNGTNSATRLGIGTNGYVLTSNGTTATWQASTGGVTSFSAGTTGFTPNTVTTGAVTLAGTLATTNGGTGLTTFTSNGAVYATSTSALTTGTLPVASGGTGATSLTGLVYGNGTTAFTAATAAQVVSVISTTAVTNSTNTTNILGGASGSLPYNSASGTTTFLSLGTTNYVLTAGATAPQYVAQSTLSVGSASTATTSTNLAGGAVGSLPYQSGSGTTTFVTGNTTTTPQFLTSTGTGSVAQAPTLTGSTGTGNVVLATSPTLVTPNLGTPSTLVGTNITGTASGLSIGGNAATATSATTATNATNVASTAGSGATNYIHFSSLATGNVAVNTNTSLTYNYTNNALTAGINGGTF